ncbi:hypothetical protein [Faecalispora anaeroviscerum]|uniref:hypothetical protein n=1 Tax=Faecalispora anaeroviscerum TaxID=2991836 RepID=UPI0024BB4088|nr:hypothetical protein [Faecalispora anaeroviscerum]
MGSIPIIRSNEKASLQGWLFADAWDENPRKVAKGTQAFGWWAEKRFYRGTRAMAATPDSHHPLQKKQANLFGLACFFCGCLEIKPTKLTKGHEKKFTPDNMVLLHELFWVLLSIFAISTVYM